MNHLHYAPSPKGKNRRSAENRPPRRQSASDGRTRASRVMVFEAVPTAQGIIRLYVETIDQISQERVIAF